MVKKSSRAEREQRFFEAVLSALGRHLSAPSGEYPTARYWRASALNRLLSAVSRDAATRMSGKPLLASAQLKARLLSAALIRPLETDGEQFFEIDLGLPIASEVDSYELLMAAEPQGVISYFSAIALHELTTQPVTHHHIAKLVPSLPEKAEPGPRGVARPVPTKNRSTLGQCRFRFNGIPYYATTRSTRLVPGIQLRNYGPKTNLRVTTYEQALLDSLAKPQHCGGPEVVFEAWEVASSSRRIDEDRLAVYLTQMNYPATTRRLAVMLKTIGHIPGKTISQVFEDTLQRLDRASQYAQIPLLPGMRYTNLDHDWLIAAP